VAAATAGSHARRRQAANAVARKSTASAESNPDHAMSQFALRWCGGSDAESQTVHGNSAIPAAPKTKAAKRRTA